MSKEVGKELEKLPSCLAKRYKILERLIKDISASTASATDARECQHNCTAKRVCSLLKACRGLAGPSEKPPSQTSLRASPEKVMSYRQPSNPPPSNPPQSNPPQRSQPMQQLTQAAGCTCKPGTRNEKTIEQTNKTNYKKRISYVDGHKDQTNNWNDINDYKKFGEAVAAELMKRNANQANMLKHQITKAILELDEGGTKSNDESYSGFNPKYASQYEKNNSQPSSDWSKNDNSRRRSILQSEIESLTPIPSQPIEKRLDSAPFYASKSEIFEYDRKEEFGSKELVLEVESSLSIDVNDTGEELIDWPAGGNMDDESVPQNALDELKKEVEEKLKNEKK